MCQCMCHIFCSADVCCISQSVLVTQSCLTLQPYGLQHHLVFSKSFLQFVMIHSQRLFSVVNETEVDVFLEFSCFLCDPVNIGNLISGSSAFFKPSLNIWKFSVHIMLKPNLKDFKLNLTSMGDECNCLVV